MMQLTKTPLIRLGNLFPRGEVYAKCEFLAPSGCFKIRGAVHLLERLKREEKERDLIVPSMGNTALGAAVGAQAFGFHMTGVVPATISKDKDDKLRALGVDLMKIDGGGNEILQRATVIAEQTGGYFVHPHLDSLWTDGYRSIVAEILEQLPECRSIVLPVGGGGLLLGLLSYLSEYPSKVRLYGCEPYNYPKYARFDHARSTTIADGLRLEKPHDQVKKVIDEAAIPIGLVSEEDIKCALRNVHDTQGLVIEPSSAITIAFVEAHAAEMEPPICALLTGQNITREDHQRLMSEA